MEDGLNCLHNGGVDAYLLQSVAIHFNHIVYSTKTEMKNEKETIFISISDIWTFQKTD